jgi:hypothetical protein
MSQDHRISPLKKADLQYRYSQGVAANDNPALRGIPDSTLLNRHEWYEMLYFINKFANECGKGLAEVARKAERLIHTSLPSHLHSHANIQQWLVQNWNLYP